MYQSINISSGNTLSQTIIKFFLVEEIFLGCLRRLENQAFFLGRQNRFWLFLISNLSAHQTGYFSLQLIECSGFSYPFSMRLFSPLRHVEQPTLAGFWSKSKGLTIYCHWHHLQIYIDWSQLLIAPKANQHNDWSLTLFLSEACRA